MGQSHAARALRCAAVAGVALGLIAGCQGGKQVQAATDGGLDGGADAQAPLTLDISVTGCADLDIANVAAVTCTGPAPLTVAFAPVGSPALTSFLWTFGDGTTPSSDPAPTHTYALPGTYSVGVTGAGTVGTVSRTRQGLIHVLALGAGAACDVDDQCGPGLSCACRPGTGCGAAFTRGICTTACTTGFCGTGAVCARYALPATADAAADDAATGAGQPAICLADCGGGAGCAPGFACQQIPAVAAAAGWVDGCLPIGAARDFGASCRSAGGALDSAACATGLCADLGALGMCSALCDEAHPCPAGGACARPAGASAPLCLPACSAGTPCASDPSIGCAAATAADAGVDGGVPIISGPVDASYCAPH